jgi:hypothetical protein
MWRQTLGVILFAASLAAPAASAAQGKSRSGPVMEIEPAEHDFGGVRQNQKLVHEFTVKNTGTDDLEILRIATSCGCTAAVTRDRIVKPGESTILEVTLETRKYSGVIQKSVSVASNDRQVVRTIKIHAFVEE